MNKDFAKMKGAYELSSLPQRFKPCFAIEQILRLENRAVLEHTNVNERCF